jgi:hypothetical protein
MDMTDDELDRDYDHLIREGTLPFLKRLEGKRTCGRRFEVVAG